MNEGFYENEQEELTQVSQMLLELQVVFSNDVFCDQLCSTYI